jgi:hypothetical protein
MAEVLRVTRDARSSYGFKNKKKKGNDGSVERPAKMLNQKNQTTEK